MVIGDMVRRRNDSCSGEGYKGIYVYQRHFRFWLYEKTMISKRVGKAELEFIHSDRDAEEKNEKVSWFELLKYKQT